MKNTHLTAIVSSWLLSPSSPQILSSPAVESHVVWMARWVLVWRGPEGCVLLHPHHPPLQQGLPLLATAPVHFCH